MFTASLLLAALVVGQGATAADIPLPDGTFYGVAGVQGFRSLYRSKLGQEPERIGRRGSIEPYVNSLVWDPVRETIFGIAYTSETRTWIEIDPKTGELKTLPWSYADASNGWAGPFGTALNPVDGMVYLVPGCPVEDFPCVAYGPRTIARFDPGTGEIQTAYTSDLVSDGFSGLTYVSKFLDEYTGLLTGSNGFSVFIGPSLIRTKIGGDASHGPDRFYDPKTGTLYAGTPSASLYGLDNQTGQTREIYRNNNSTWPQFSEGNYVYVPDVAAIAPTCRLSDSDDDADIDLHDFANFQNCWTGPHE